MRAFASNSLYLCASNTAKPCSVPLLPLQKPLLPHEMPQDYSKQARANCRQGYTLFIKLLEGKRGLCSCVCNGTAVSPSNSAAYLSALESRECSTWSLISLSKLSCGAGGRKTRRKASINASAGPRTRLSSQLIYAFGEACLRTKRKAAKRSTAGSKVCLAGPIGPSRFR